MKRPLALFLLFAITVSLSAQKHQSRSETELENGWISWLTESNQKEAVLNDTVQVSLPHNWDDYYGYRQLPHGNLHGTAVYERHLTVAKEPGKCYFLRLEGAGSYAAINLNGTVLSREPVGRTTLTVDITGAVRDGDNTLRIITEHPEMITDMPWTCGGCDIGSEFNEGSQPLGLFRPVVLEVTDQTRVEPFGIHIWNNAKADSLFIDTEIKNYGKTTVNLRLENDLIDHQNKRTLHLCEEITVLSGETVTAHQKAALRNPHLWSLSDPYLYDLATSIKMKGSVKDRVDTPFGIRTCSWPAARKDGDGRFFLNGEPVFINGTAEYEHLFGQSHAFSREQISARAKLVEAAGFNAFRDAHHPHNLDYQKHWDEDGLLWWTQFTNHIWYDTKEFRENYKMFITRWVKERRNSPSLVLWGLQNESALPEAFAKECTELIHQLDPTAGEMRLVTTCNYGEGTDWNVIQNWSGTYGGDVNKYAEELKDKEQLLNGEYGAWRTFGMRGNEGHSEDNFLNIMGRKMELAESVRDSVCGHFQWIFISHDNPGQKQPDGAYRRVDKIGPINFKGLLTNWEEPTKGYYLYQCRYSKDQREQPQTIFAGDLDLNGAEGYSYLYRINCGGDRYVDSSGQAWNQDNNILSHSWAERFEGMNPYQASQRVITEDIRGTEDDALFQSFRFGRRELRWQLPLADGDYRVELYFSEPWHYDTGLRMFDVAFNDSVVLDDFDIYSQAGHAGAVKTVKNVRVEGGTLKISFPQVKVGQAVICAIAVARLGEWRAPVQKEAPVSPTMWKDFDADTVAVLSDADLPGYSHPRRPQTAVQTKGADGAFKFRFSIAKAHKIALHFSFTNQTGKDIRPLARIIDSKGTTVDEIDINFHPTWIYNQLSVTLSNVFINAGSYDLVFDGKGLDIEKLNVQ